MMKSKTKNKTSILKKSNYQSLVQSIGSLIESVRVRVVQAINTEMVNLYWEIGRHIVEYEQGGGDRAKYGSITSKWEHFFDWKRNDEADAGSLEAQMLLDGMLAKDKLLDLLENFILFDDSRAGGTRKVVARNQQVLGVNNAVDAVAKQQALKDRYPVDERLIKFTVSKAELRMAAEGDKKEHLAHRDEGIQVAKAQPTEILQSDDDSLPLVKRAHQGTPPLRAG